MQIVRTILWVLLAVTLVLFAVANWTPVTVQIWTNLVLETKLAVLVVGAFLLGLVPMWLVHRVVAWRLRRRLDAQTPASLPDAAPPALHHGERHAINPATTIATPDA